MPNGILSRLGVSGHAMLRVFAFAGGITFEPSETLSEA
jgi:hypothetical protein